MLHYSIHKLSDSAPWVTFVHGAGGSSTIWYKQIRAFKEDFNLLLIDLRGHGKSKGGAYERLKRYSFEHIGNEVMEVLDHLKIETSHFVGISLGTIIIRDINERFPARTSGMVMGGAIVKLNLRAQVLMRFGDIVKSIVPFILLYRFFAFIIMPRKTHRESRNLFIREAKKVYEKEFKRWFTLISEINPLLALFRFKDPGNPTLYIMGEEDHMFLPAITRLVNDHSSSQLHIIPSCGHVVNVESPAIFNKEAISFLTSLQRGPITHHREPNY